MAISVGHTTHEEQVAGVVLCALVGLAPEELSLQDVITTCERNPCRLKDEQAVS
jgi:hypothetical protein